MSGLPRQTGPVEHRLARHRPAHRLWAGRSLEGGARLACAAPVDALARLDAIAMATPRTLRLAGSPETGSITWITRSRLWGFPDYTTAQITETDTGPRLDIFARLRFGRSDLGVNAARLQAWVNQL